MEQTVQDAQQPRQRRARTDPASVLMRQGFYASVLYCALGLGLELLQQRLPGAVYERLAATLYGLPRHLLDAFDLHAPLVRAVAQGELPAWLGRAAIPSAGVLAILACAALCAAALRFVGFVVSLKQS